MAPAKVTLVQVNAKLQWQTQRAQGGNWVAFCEPLKLTFQAETWANLLEDIALGLDAMLKDLMVNNELDRFLRDRGWTTMGPIPAEPKNIRFDIPFYILPAPNAHGPQRRPH